MTRMISAIAAVAVLALGGFMLMPRAGEMPVNPLIGAANAQQKAADVDISSVADMTLGKADAPVTVVEYSSYTCPHCAEFHEGPFKQLKADFIDTGKVKFIYREAFFDRYGLWASMVARCEPSKFFGISDLIFESQSDWLRAGDANAVVAELRKMGRVAGLSEDKLNACLTDAQTAQTMVAWYQDHFERDGITGTPSFMINGTKVDNQSYDGLKKIIEAELAK